MRFLETTLFVILISTLSGCSLFPSPEGFWLNYQEDDRTENYSDQGPWGGKRIIHWKKDIGKFNIPSVIKFAEDNGWKLQNNSLYNSSLTNKWVYDNKPIFPLYYKGFISHFDFSYSGFADYPRWISGDIKVLTFTTNFISIDPGTQEEIRRNGFIILNSEQNEMTLYHMWGE
ncbi:hypothetical protein [Fulvivirga ligni]|uniref:hypothetical protein n=1 Tax=Fulvivirga ligni TaxID=2904246 RepID=UPI001F41E8CC|nr:hypothetical protein [Fulvivirga ligni]UII20537.1 hypothetical protein LVD16_22105 [Fulvivirga ligni]